MEQFNEKVYQALKYAISTKESHGNRNSYNPDSGAKGVYQYLQSTWDSFARMAGLNKWVGVDPRKAPPEVQDAVFKKNMEYFWNRYKGHVGYIAVAHYAGETNADYWYRKKSYRTEKEYCNGVAYDSQAEYAQKVMNYYSKALSNPTGGFNSTAVGFSKMQNTYYDNYEANKGNFIDTTKISGYSEGDLPGSSGGSGNTPASQRGSEPSFWEKFSTGFSYGISTTGVALAARELWAHASAGGQWQDLTQEDIDYVQETFKDDPDLAKYVLVNSRNSADVKEMVAMKLKDVEREKKIAQYNQRSMMTLANAGIMVGSIFDPLNLLGGGGAITKGVTGVSKVAVSAAKGARAVNILGKSIRSLDKVSAIARSTPPIVKVAGQSAAINMAFSGVDDYLREKHGQQVNYATNAAVAAVSGAVLGGLGYGVAKRFRKTQQVAEKLESHAIIDSMHEPDVAKKIKSETFNLLIDHHDATLGTAVDSKIYKGLDAKGKVIATEYKKVAPLVKKYRGVELDKKAKAFYVPNEDYIVLIKDNLPKTKDGRIDGQALDKILSHEYAVHGSLRDALGDKPYNKMMKEVSALADKEGHVFNAIRREIKDYDPEEILAYALEQGKLPKDSKFFGRLRRAFNKKLGQEEHMIPVTEDELLEIMKQRMANQRAGEDPNKVFYNADNTTAFAGIKFSKDNMLNPYNWEAFYTLEPEAVKSAQAEVWRPLRGAGRRADQFSDFGVMLNSASNTLRGAVWKLLVDPRGRAQPTGIPPAEHIKDMMSRQLYKYVDEYGSLFNEWAAKHIADNIKHPKSPQALREVFDAEVVKAFNAHATVDGTYRINAPRDVDPIVARAVNTLSKYREHVITMGQNSSKYTGLDHPPMIEKDWYTVDHEFTRRVDPVKARAFLAKFIDEKEAIETVKAYIRQYADYETIANKIDRNRYLTAQRQGKPYKEKEITRAEAEQYLEEHLDSVVGQWLEGLTDIEAPIHKGALGTVKQFKERIPMDTSATYTVTRPDGSTFEFSFDNDLRYYNVEQMMKQEINRFTGEATMKSIYGSDQALQREMAKVKKELDLAVSNGHMDKKRADRQWKTYQETIDRLRGIRTEDDIIGSLGVLARLGRTLSYVVNGTNMGWAQLGELGGTMAYGGVSQMFHVFKPLGRFVDKIRWGKLTQEAVEDLEYEIFGTNLEEKIFTHSLQDNLVRANLTKIDSLSNKALISMSDKALMLSKVTSMLNGLPKMTDAMVRGMRKVTIKEFHDWANGKTFSAFRNPFSDKKLASAGIDHIKAQKLKDDFLKYQKVNEDGKWIGLDIEKWKSENPVSYAQFTYVIERHAQRAIISGRSLGNRFGFKEKNEFNKMLFQFKDYTFRAINGQLFRALTTRELDDLMAAGMSTITNTAFYAARYYAVIKAYEMAGNHKKAEEVKNRAFAPENLYRAVAFRAVMNSPLSLANDVYEGLGFTDSTIRTTVNGDQVKRKPKDMTATQRMGRAVQQIPALDMLLNTPYEAYKYGESQFGDSQKQKDMHLKKLLRHMPLTNWIPFAAFFNSIGAQQEQEENK